MQTPDTIRARSLFRYASLSRFTCKKKNEESKTTDSFHRFRKYPNLIEEYSVTGPEQLWVSAITYIRTAEGFSYLSLITDAYSRKIVGYSLYPTLEAKGCVEALEMAIRSRIYPDNNIIHHSDRGIQYCCNQYIELLKNNSFQVSMTQSGNSYDNALAERMNCTIKTDYFTGKMYRSHVEAETEMERIVNSYNKRRPHQSLNYLTPSEAHNMEGEIVKRWKKYKRRTKAQRNATESTLSYSLRSDEMIDFAGQINNGPTQGIQADERKIQD